MIHTHLRRSTRIVSKLKTHAAKIATLHIKINGKCFLQMDGLVCNAQWQVETIPSNYTGKYHKANNSLSPHRRLSDAEILTLRNSLNIGRDDIFIGGVGRYHPSKAWDTLISAFKQLPNYSDAKLHIFGCGNQEEPLRKLAGDDHRIKLAGYRNDIKDLYQTFDILACPSRFDPLPRAILEAMDAGTPVIASNAGGCKELINDYGGQLFECDNIENLALKLARWLKNKPARHRPDLSAHYLEKTNTAMIDFYRQLIAEKRH
ncbi:glycosyltransferase [Teredinibacter purpureus]|uniref:glycosyltransferase n=1 Tax=Teredinibacter purpureus TaxID=2731756 RepID=UPI001F1F10AC|nr:glycosyltransferase [Teredinibacter purpureus]